MIVAAHEQLGSRHIVVLVLDEISPSDLAMIIALERLGLSKTDSPLCAAHCPYCEWNNSYSSDRNARRGRSAHIRQMHRLEWQFSKTVQSERAST